MSKSAQTFATASRIASCSAVRSKFMCGVRVSGSEQPHARLKTTHSRVSGGAMSTTTERRTVLVYDPTVEEANDQEGLARRAATLDGKTIGLLDNTKDLV